MLNREYTTFMACDSDFEGADMVLFGAPYDSTVSNRPGARFGPRAIRQESFGIETYSPYQDKDLTGLRVFDSGDLELPFGDSRVAIGMISERASEILAAGKIPVMIGGEHLVTLGAVTAAAKFDPDLHIIHFDAHTDLRDGYLGAALSHACVIRRCWEILGDMNIFQFGIRSGSREEFEWAKGRVKTVMFGFDDLPDVIDALIKANKPVYFTIDLDVLDPSELPGTGSPEAGGVSFKELLAAIRETGRANVVACDITELAPNLDHSGVSGAAACKVLRELLLAI
jgi:agmatinase